MGIHRGEQAVDVEAPPAACFEAITDYESFPRWQTAVNEVEVLDRYPDGRGRRVRVRADAKVREVSYVLHYHYEPPRRVWWDYVEGDVADAEGEYVFEALADGRRTRAVYRVGIDFGLPVPGILVNRLQGGVMRRAARDLKEEVERRVRTAGA